MSLTVVGLIGVNALLNVLSYMSKGGAIDADWATPLNTLFLILFALVNYWVTRKLSKDANDAKAKARQAQEDATDAKRKVGAVRREQDPE